MVGFKINTPVLMGDGTYKNIQDVVKDDLVMSYDEETKEFKAQTVVNTFTNTCSEITTYEFSDSTVVTGCADLKFFKSTGEYGVLEIGDEVVKNGAIEPVTLTAKTTLEGTEETVYDLDVEDIDNFTVNGIVVHNSAYTLTVNLSGVSNYCGTVYFYLRLSCTTTYGADTYIGHIYLGTTTTIECSSYTVDLGTDTAGSDWLRCALGTTTCITANMSVVVATAQRASAVYPVQLVSGDSSCDAFSTSSSSVCVVEAAASNATYGSTVSRPQYVPMIYGNAGAFSGGNSLTITGQLYPAIGVKLAASYTDDLSMYGSTGTSSTPSGRLPFAPTCGYTTTSSGTGAYLSTSVKYYAVRATSSYYYYYLSVGYGTYTAPTNETLDSVSPTTGATIGSGTKGTYVRFEKSSVWPAKALSGYTLTCNVPTYTVSFEAGTGVSSVYSSTSSSATSGNVSGYAYNSGKTVYVFAVLTGQYNANSSWTYKSGGNGANTPGAIYLVTTYSSISENKAYGTVSASSTLSYKTLDLKTTSGYGYWQDYTDKATASTCNIYYGDTICIRTDYPTSKAEGSTWSSAHAVVTCLTSSWTRRWAVEVYPNANRQIDTMYWSTSSSSTAATIDGRGVGYNTIVSSGYTSIFASMSVSAYTITWKYLNSAEYSYDSSTGTYSWTGWTTETQLYAPGTTPSRTLASQTSSDGTYRAYATSWDDLSAVTADREITANYNLQWYFTINSASNCSANYSSGWYTPNQSLTITWTVDDTNRYTFNSGQVTAANTSQKSTTVTYNGSITSANVYTRLYTITWSYGSSLDSSGAVVTTTATQNYEYNATPSKTVSSLYYGTNNMCRTFSSWDSLAAVTASRTITASYSSLLYYVTVSCTNCTCDISSGYKTSGTKITANFTANSDYSFSDGSTRDADDQEIINSLSSKDTVSANAQYVYGTATYYHCDAASYHTGYHLPTSSFTVTPSTNYSFAYGKTASSTTAAWSLNCSINKYPEYCYMTVPTVSGLVLGSIFDFTTGTEVSDPESGYYYIVGDSLTAYWALTWSSTQYTLNGTDKTAELISSSADSTAIAGGTISSPTIYTRQYKITTSGGNYCTVSPSYTTATAVDYGTTITFTAKSNYAFSVNGTNTQTKTVTAAGSYTTNPTYVYCTFLVENCKEASDEGWYAVGSKAASTTYNNFSYADKTWGGSWSETIVLGTTTYDLRPLYAKTLIFTKGVTKSGVTEYYEYTNLHSRRT